MVMTVVHEHSCISEWCLLYFYLLVDFGFIGEEVDECFVVYCVAYCF